MAVFTVAAAMYAYRERRPDGSFVEVPYDFRFPTLRRLRERWWNPEDTRLFTPQVFGVGWSVNLHRLVAVLSRDQDANGPDSGA